MALKKQTSVSSLKSRPAVAGWRLRLSNRSRPTLSSRAKERELREELRKIKSLVETLNAILQRSENRIDASLEFIDRTLENLARQKEEILRLERSLGIERKSA